MKRTSAYWSLLAQLGGRLLVSAVQDASLDPREVLRPFEDIMPTIADAIAQRAPHTAASPTYRVFLLLENELFQRSPLESTRYAAYADAATELVAAFLLECQDAFSLPHIGACFEALDRVAQRDVDHPATRQAQEQYLFVKQL